MNYRCKFFKSILATRWRDFSIGALGFESPVRNESNICIGGHSISADKSVKLYINDVRPRIALALATPLIRPAQGVIKPLGLFYVVLTNDSFKSKQLTIKCFLLSIVRMNVFGLGPQKVELLSDGRLR